MKLNEKDPGRRATLVTGVPGRAGGGRAREMCDRKEEKRERVDGARRVSGLNVENASAEKRERDKEYTLRVRSRYTRRAVGGD